MSEVATTCSFLIVQERERRHRNFETLAREVTLIIDPPPAEDVVPSRWLRDTNHLLTDDVALQDRIGFSFFGADREVQNRLDSLFITEISFR